MTSIVGYYILLCHSWQLPNGIELIFLNFISRKHTQSNYWFKELCNNTCSNTIGQLCKIKSNSFCHSLIYRSAWAEAPPVSESVRRCCVSETCPAAASLAQPPRCRGHAEPAAPSCTFSQENRLFIDPAQLQPVCPSAILGPNQGNPGYPIAGTGTVGKCCGQAVRNTVAHLPVAEHLLQGRSTNQRWVLPRPLKLNSHKTAPGVYSGRSVPGTCCRYFHTSSGTGNRIPKHQAGGVKTLGATLNPFSCTFLVSSSTPLSPFNRG